MDFLVSRKNVRVVAQTPPPPPPPPQRGTFLTIEPTADSLTYGNYTGTLADGCSEVTYDWGDGTVETFESFTHIAHTYAQPGRYVVKISDNLSVLGCSAPVGQPVESKVYSKLLKEVFCNAEKITVFNNGGFRQSENLVRFDIADSAVTTLRSHLCYGCTRLAGKIDLPHVIDAEGGNTSAPFVGCDALEELCFAKANEQAIRNSAAFKAEPPFGAPNAVISFDL